MHEALDAFKCQGPCSYAGCGLHGRAKKAAGLRCTVLWCAELRLSTGWNRSELRLNIRWWRWWCRGFVAAEKISEEAGGVRRLLLLLSQLPT